MDVASYSFDTAATNPTMETDRLRKKEAIERHCAAQTRCRD